MMSLVANPVVTARVTAPRRAARKMTVSASAASTSARSTAVAGAVALVISAQPALAAADMAGVFDVPAPNQVREHPHVSPRPAKNRAAQSQTPAGGSLERIGKGFQVGFGAAA